MSHGTVRKVDVFREAQRHINGVVSNGVVPKSQICKLVAKPAPDIFRIPASGGRRHGVAVPGGQATKKPHDAKHTCNT